MKQSTKKIFYKFFVLHSLHTSTTPGSVFKENIDKDHAKCSLDLYRQHAKLFSFSMFFKISMKLHFLNFDSSLEGAREL